MRKVVALIVAVCGLGFASGVTASTTQVNGQFTVHFGRGLGTSNAPCLPDTFCGTGTLTGFGQATDTLEFTSFEPIEGTSCFAVTLVETIELANGSGTLVLPSEGTFCSPGNSDNAPVPPQDYGHPHTITASFTVDGGTSSGIFAHASGSGKKLVSLAGDVATIKLSGNLALAS